MSVKKILKLVNNERVNSKLVSQKACDATSKDVCPYVDNAECTTYSYDKCTKEDYAACYNYSDDTCTSDFYPCHNGEADIEQ